MILILQKRKEMSYLRLYIKTPPIIGDSHRVATFRMNKQTQILESMSLGSHVFKTKENLSTNQLSLIKEFTDMFLSALNAISNQAFFNLEFNYVEIDITDPLEFIEQFKIKQLLSLPL
jgi:hypothetical protein